MVSSTFISSVSKLKWHFFSAVKFRSACTAFLSFVLMAKEFDGQFGKPVWFIERWLSILAHSCLVVMLVCDIFPSQEHVQDGTEKHLTF